jgi:hypothetical protein
LIFIDFDKVLDNFRLGRGFFEFDVPSVNHCRFLIATVIFKDTIAQVLAWPKQVH